MAETPSAGTGAVMRPDTLQRYAAEPAFGKSRCSRLCTICGAFIVSIPNGHIRKDTYMTPIIHSVTLPNQVTLPYVEQGDPTGVPVLLLHGITDSWRSFEGVLPHLPRPCLLPCRNGAMAMRLAPTGYYPQDFAADLAAFMDTLKLGPAVVVGHSMGSYIAQRFALDYPDRTLGLVLMGSCTTVRGNPVAMELWDSVVSTLTDPIDPGFVREFQQSTLARPCRRPCSIPLCRRA